MMFDFSYYLEDFYDNYLVLPKEAKDSLYDKKEINIKRLYDGLAEYNIQNNKNYEIEKIVVQGSMAMDTAIQNEEKDFDIDVGVIFDYDSIGNLGFREIKNIIKDCFLKKWPDQFNSKPEVKKNCVRIVYEEGYHIDFAIYRHIKAYSFYEEYEHAGSNDWNKRDPNSINNWFDKEIDEKGEKLRKIIRFSKAICKSSHYTEMVGGLIQSVLCAECFCDNQRLDYSLINTFKQIISRLECISDVFNPTDMSLSLIQTEKHKQQLSNYKELLKSTIKKINELETIGAGFNEASKVWNDVFNCDYWNIKLEESYSGNTKYRVSVIDNNSFETFIEDFYHISPSIKKIDLDCTIGFKENKRRISFHVIRARYKGIPIGPHIFVTARPSFPYDKILWKVRNRGPNATTPEKIRGQISQDRGLSIEESLDFDGDHYIECYAIKNGVCVGYNKINVRIIPKRVSVGRL